MGVTDSLGQLADGLRNMIDIVLIIAILILILIILKLVEKGYRVKLDLKKKDRNIFYKKELMKLKNIRGNPEKVLDKVNIVARGYFKEAFDLDYHLEYLELAKEFRKKGVKEGISFCTLISELNYSGEIITEKKTDVLLGLLEKIMRKNRIISEEEKELMKKKKKLQIINLGRSGEKKADEQISKIAELRKAKKFRDKKSDINRINWKYKLRITFLKLRGKLPELQKRSLERKNPVSHVN
jgi:hypothetical protein